MWIETKARYDDDKETIISESKEDLFKKARSKRRANKIKNNILSNISIARIRTTVDKEKFNNFEYFLPGTTSSGATISRREENRGIEEKINVNMIFSFKVSPQINQKIFNQMKDFIFNSGNKFYSACFRMTSPTHKTIIQL